MNKSYLLAIFMPVLFCIGAMGYLSSFEVPLLAQVQLSEKKIQENEGEPVVLPGVWDKVKDRENPTAKELVFALAELQKEADMQLEKIYKLQEFELMNSKMGEQLQNLQKLERNFYFPPSTIAQEVVTLDDIEVLGIFYGKATIKISDEPKERAVQVGESVKRGKVKILEIRSDAVVFSVEGKRVVKAIKK